MYSPPHAHRELTEGGGDAVRLRHAHRAGARATAPRPAPAREDGTHGAGVTVRVTLVPWGKSALQVVPQCIPSGLLVTRSMDGPCLDLRGRNGRMTCHQTLRGRGYGRQSPPDKHGRSY